MLKNLCLTALCAAAFLTLTPNSFAQTCPGSPGCLDPSFGTNGMTVVAPPLADMLESPVTLDMVEQNDGKIVVLTAARDSGATFRNVLIRYYPDGQLDTTFASGGYLYIAQPPASSFGAYARQIGKQTIGGNEYFVLASGDRCNGDPCVRVERYTTSGTLDTSFGDGGAAFISYGALYITAVAVQADQKIILGSPQYPLARLNANGSPDNSFGSGGVATFNDTRMLVGRIVALPDGKILTAGTYLSPASGDFYVARFTSNGRSDGSFGSLGKRVIDFAGGEDSAEDIAVDAAGNIVAVGNADVSGTPEYDFARWDAVIVRMNAKGTLDKKFGKNGVSTPLDTGGNIDSFQSVSILSNGKIVSTGVASPAGANWDILTARYNGNGTLDATFHGDGWNLTDVLGADEFATRGIVQIDPSCSCAKLLVAATARTGPYTSPQFIGVLRYGL